MTAHRPSALDAFAYRHTGPVRLYLGDARQVLAAMPDGGVDCLVTSPPFWSLRDYGTGRWRGGDPACPHRATSRADGAACAACGAAWTDPQYGLEPTVEQYVDRLVAVFDEAHRVLTPTGTLWLNLGDNYAGGARRAYDTSGPITASRRPPGTRNGSLLPAKNLIGVPWRVAFALQATGAWYLRNAIIWAKTNPMPESVGDRLSTTYELLFLLTRSHSYYFDLDPIRLPLKHPDAADGSRVFGGANKASTGGIDATARRRGARYGVAGKYAAVDVGVEPGAGRGNLRPIGHAHTAGVAVVGRPVARHLDDGLTLPVTPDITTCAIADSAWRVRLVEVPALVVVRGGCGRCYRSRPMMIGQWSPWPLDDRWRSASVRQAVGEVLHPHTVFDQVLVGYGFGAEALLCHQALEVFEVTGGAEEDEHSATGLQVATRRPEERRQRPVVLVRAGGLEEVAGGEPAERRVEDDQVECAVNGAEHIAVAHVDAVRDTVAFGVGPGRGQRLRVDVDRYHLPRGAGRQDRVDAAAGAHVQHPVGRAHLGQYRFAEQVGHGGDGHDVGRHHDGPAEIGESLDIAPFGLGRLVCALMPLADAFGVLGGHRRGVVGGVGHDGTVGEPGGTGDSFSPPTGCAPRCGSSPTRPSELTGSVPPGNVGGVLGSGCAGHPHPVGRRADVQAEQMAEHDGRDIPGEVEHCCVPCRPHPDSDGVEPAGQLFGIERPSGHRAGEQPHAGGGVDATLVHELGEQAVHGRRYLDGFRAQRQRDVAAVVPDVVGGEADDPAAGLGEQKYQQPGDPVAEVEAGVVQEPAQQAPAPVVGDERATASRGGAGISTAGACRRATAQSRKRRASERCPGPSVSQSSMSAWRQMARREPATRSQASREITALTSRRTASAWV